MNLICNRFDVCKTNCEHIGRVRAFIVAAVLYDWKSMRTKSERLQVNWGFFDSRLCMPFKYGNKIIRASEAYTQQADKIACDWHVLWDKFFWHVFSLALFLSSSLYNFCSTHQLQLHSHLHSIKSDCVSVIHSLPYSISILCNSTVFSSSNEK